MKSSKKKQVEHENHERWMVSYADFVTLLFAFFVVMYAANRADSKRVTQVTQAIQWAMHFEGRGGVREMPTMGEAPSEGGCAVSLGPDERTLKENQKASEEWKRRLLRRLKVVDVKNPAHQAITIEVENHRVTVRLAASAFFDPGSIELKPEAIPIVRTLAEEMALWHRPIRVEGHTDNTPLGPSTYRSNWELSAFRASSIVGMIEKSQQMPSSFLTATGKGPSQPLAPNDSPENREKNRRVELTMDVFPGDALSVLTLLKAD